MPTISEFIGIRIETRFLDHNMPHLYAKYQKDKVSVEIKDGKVKGEMSLLAILPLHPSKRRVHSKLSPSPTPSNGTTAASEASPNTSTSTARSHNACRRTY